MADTWTERAWEVISRDLRLLLHSSRPPSKRPLTFEEVLDAEMDTLRGDEPPATSYSGELPVGSPPPQKPPNVYARAHWHRLVGLAFSGGGIRSATFNLGVLQALARFGLLRSFDYLSTVSGGGYIGAWLSAWVNREECAAVVEKKGRSVVDARLRNGGLEALERRLKSQRAPRAARKWLLAWIGSEEKKRDGVDRKLRGTARLDGGKAVAAGLASIHQRLRSSTGGHGFDVWLSGWIRDEGLEALKAEHQRDAPDRSLGEWLSSQSECAGLDTVERKLEREIPRLEKTEEIAPDREWSPITFLRRYSNYLTPRLGLFGIDTWTAVATYFRNLLLNLTMLVLSLAVILLLPRLFVWQTMNLGTSGAGWGLLAAGVTLIALSLGVTTLRLERARRVRDEEFTPGREAARDRLPEPAGDESSLGDRLATGLVVAPLALAGVAIALWTSAGNYAGMDLPFELVPDFGRYRYPAWMAGTALVYLLAWLPALIGMALLRIGRGGGEALARRALGIAASGLAAGAVGGAILGWLAWTFRGTSGAEPVEAAILAVPGVLITFVIVSAIQVGLMGRAFYERHRQWWNRLSGWLLLIGTVWAGLFALVFCGPAVIEWLADEVRPYLRLGWLAATGVGIWAGRSPLTGGRRPTRRWFEPIAVVAPYLFMLGLAIAVSGSTQQLAERIIEGLERPPASEVEGLERPPASEVVAAPFGGPAVTPIPEVEAKAGFPAVWKREGERVDRSLQEHGWVFLAIALVLAAAAFLISWRLDVNAFSMHNFYRNRLIRAYLGASRVMQREPDPFTGFDPDDDFPLSRLRGSRPLPVLNTTLSVTSGEELAWQERKAASFFFTPLHFGFDPGRFSSRADERGFRSVPLGAEEFTLGTAMAISGAAVSPNMGQHSSPALAFLMTIFNTRLGWWLRNPNHPKWSKRGPKHAIGLLLGELRGACSSTSRYVNLSDGGFFDNLGIYELVRRRCRFILACDAEADPDYRFSALGNAIRRCRSDFGVDIDIQLDSIRPQAETGHSRWHCAVGTIHYDTDDGAPNGTLVYLKASLTGDEPEDLLNYAGQHEKFPHEPTADQWFGEAQFESYRTLGFHAAQTLLSTAGRTEIDREDPESVDIESVFVDLKQAWYPPSSATARSFTRHTERLVEIFDRLRRNRNLRFLDRNLYLDLDAWQKTGIVKPGRPTGEPSDEDEVRAGFYLCSSMIQLMENVYLDLDLGSEADHPDNRGWMNLFRHWASTPTFRRTWAVSAATYGARFQTFCRRQLHLEMGRLWVDCYEIPDQATATESIELLREQLGGLAGDDAKRLLEALGGLSAIEEDLFLETYRQEVPELGETRPTRLGVLMMSVLAPEAAHRRKPAERKPEDYAREPAGSEMSFPIGFALLGREESKDPETGTTSTAESLRFFRIRNHLRTLGLGRQAMRCLVRMKPPVVVDSLLRRGFARGLRQQVKNMFRSVVNERRHG